MKKLKYVSFVSEVDQQRDYKVVKSNALIQKNRYDLSVQEQKILLHVIKMIRPDDTEFAEEYRFSIQDFCRICGINKSGANYRDIKACLLSLSKQKWWMTAADGSGDEVTAGWIARARISQGDGTVTLQLDEELKPYLLQLHEYFTKYSLYYTLTMRSKYSIRLYELFKSYENLESIELDVNELKKILMAEKYERWADFRRYCLEGPINEINKVGDIVVDWTPQKVGRQYQKIQFSITAKDVMARTETWAEIEYRLNKNIIPGQLSLAMMEDLQSN